MKKIILFLSAFLCCFFMNFQIASATEVAEEGTTLTVYVKNTAGWDTINIYAWDEYEGAATNMEWTETPMEDLGNGWRSYTLTTYKEFFLCFQDGGSVWTNDVPVQAGVTELYLDLTATVKGEKQVCQYTDEKPDATAVTTDTTEETEVVEVVEETEATEATAVAEEELEGTTLTVYMKNTAGWDIINIYAWDDYDGAATNMEWTETPMEDLGNGWRSYTLTTYKEFYLCFQDGGSVWTNDVPVEAGVTELYLELTATLKGDKQVCQYTDAKPGEETVVEEAVAEEEATEAVAETATEESGVNGGVIAVVVIIVAVLAAGAFVLIKKKKK